MPYYQTKDTNLLFIHIPKTGGSSVEQFLARHYRLPLNPRHMCGRYGSGANIGEGFQYNVYLQHQTYQVINKYKQNLHVNFDNIKFLTIVRNPYKKIMSALFFLRMVNVNTNPEQVFETIKSFLVYSKMLNFNTPQYQFLIDENEELIKNLTIIRTESLDKDMIDLGYTKFNYKRRVNRARVDYFKYLNADSIKLINETYAKDFEMFGYEMINPDTPQ